MPEMLNKVVIRILCIVASGLTTTNFTNKALKGSVQKNSKKFRKNEMYSLDSSPPPYMRKVIKVHKP